MHIQEWVGQAVMCLNIAANMENIPCFCYQYK